MKKKERVFEVFVYLISGLHILAGIAGIIMSRNIENAGTFRLMLLYMALFGASLLALFRVSNIYHNLVHRLKNASVDTINSLVEELQKTKN